SLKRKKYVTLTVKDKAIEDKSEEEISNEQELFIENKNSNLWIKCPSCKEILYKDDLDQNLKKCPLCDHYFYMTAYERINLLIDEGTFEEFDSKLVPCNPLSFPDYNDKYQAAVDKTGLIEGVISGVGNLSGIKISLAAMDFSFMGGSMGSVVGEKLTRAIERAASLEIPLILVSTSGGARMHEGIFSLMQMAKTSAAIERLKIKGIPYISIPVDPTTGGVTASFAMLGDIILTEPKALIGFAGPRVIEETIKQQLPEGFQRSEFLQEHGMIDVIAKREEMKEVLYRLLSRTS
ncbi:MAG: acetyl-CoA carboxylase, carboxyltransferase subunit beta, partial [Fusobacteriaceae bacterium]